MVEFLPLNSELAMFVEPSSIKSCLVNSTPSLVLTFRANNNCLGTGYIAHISTKNYSNLYTEPVAEILLSTDYQEFSMYYKAVAYFGNAS